MNTIPRYITKSLIFVIFLLLPLLVDAQENRLVQLEQKLDLVAQKSSALNEQVTISLNGSIQEMLALLAESTSVNLSIDPNYKANVSNTFTNTPVKDVLLYLCDAHKLDLKFTGAIIQLVPYVKPPEVIPLKELDIKYDATQKMVTLDLQGDTLAKVVQLLSELTQQNIVLDPVIRNRKVNGFINNVPLEVALKQLAVNNNIELDEEEEDYFYLKGIAEQAKEAGRPKTGKAPDLNVANLSVKRTNNDQVSVNALNVDILDVIKETALQLKVDYFVLPENGDLRSTKKSANDSRNNRQNTGGKDAVKTLKASGTNVSIQLNNASFEEVLTQVCKNSGYTFVNEKGLFIIGKRTAEGMRETKLIQLQYRSAKGVLDFIPEEMLRGVDIDTLLELNSLILSGSKRNIVEVDSFLQSIDKLVPVVMIELIIVDVQKDMLREIGVEAGVVKGGKEAGGTVVSSDEDRGGLDFTFSPDAINRVLRLLSGQNVINLGQVNNDFYLNLQAIEQKGFIEIKSTPKLATLNSHLASLSIGQKRYYLEQETNFAGSNNPILSQSNQYKEVEANLQVDITPVVSGDEQVTLEIAFEQSEFIGTPAPNAPPPQVSRKFDSMVRIRNGEMIVLGGLERDTNSKVKRGVPFLSRIPLIGWMFGKKKKSKSENKLLIFVRPTIIN